MLRRVHALLTGLFLAGTTLGLSGVASANHADCTDNKFCGWNGADYAHNTKLYTISGSPGTVILLSDADRDKTTSLRNRTSNWYCGVNQLTLQPDETVVEVGPGQRIANLGSQSDNKIDHYDVKASQGNCHNPV